MKANGEILRTFKRGQWQLDKCEKELTAAIDAAAKRG